MNYALRSLQSHSYLLSCFILNGLNREASKRHIAKSIVSSQMAAEWLEIAASVKHVEVDMCEHDNSLAYCGTAYRFQKARGEKMSDLSRSLTIFNFVWNSFEILCKCMHLPKVPKAKKSGRQSFVDLAQYYILNGFSANVQQNLLYYEKMLNKLISNLTKVNDYNLEHAFSVNSYTSRDGVGVQIVRTIRNLFAHGAVHPPEHEDYSFDHYIDSKIIDISSRIVLMTIQMLLLSENFISYDPKIGFFEKDYPFWEGIDWGYLHVLHVKAGR